MKKIAFLITFLLTQSLLLTSQESESHYVLETDSSWFKEMFTFPIGFAQEIKYVGIEDARFPQGWSKEASPNFWSYVFAWYVELKEEVDPRDLEKNLQFYFDGLLGLGNKDASERTNVTLVKDNHSVTNSSYVGQVKTLDTRYTKKPMILHTYVDQYFCEDDKKTILFFKFSPKEFGHDVWELLAHVKLQEGICSH